MKATAPWPLTGRAEELNLVVATLDGSGNDAGIVLAGHPGVGKTRLAREAAARAAERGWTVRWIAGTDAAQQIPLGSFAQWVTDIDEHPLRIVGDVIAAVTASPDGGPVLVVVDDAHLLDGLSAFVLHQLVIRRAALVIVTIRSGGSAPDAVTALWKDSVLRRIDLQPLSRSQCDLLLEQVLGGPAEESFAARLWHLTFGNVLFLRQLVISELDARRLIAGDGEWRWTGSLTLAGSVLELIDTQIGAVSDTAGDVLDLVAIAEPLELRHLARLADGAAIEYCEQQGLISVAPADRQERSVRVGHPLYGEARRARLGAVRLARLSGRIASVMLADDADNAADPVRIGQLWLQSDLEPDAEIFMRAAQVAYPRHDIDLTSRFAEAAVAAGAGAEARLLLAHTLMHSAAPQRAQEILDQLANEPLPEILRSVVGQLRAANLLWPLASPELSWRVVDDELTNPSADVAANASAFRVMQCAMGARPREAESIASGIDRSRLGSMPTLMLAWAMSIAWGDLGRPDESVAAAEDAAAVSTWPSAALQAPGSSLVALQALILAGDIDRARRLADWAEHEWGDVPGVFRTFVATMGAVALLGAGDVPAARARLHGALAESQASSTRIGAHYLLLLVYLESLCYTADTDAIDEALEMLAQHRHSAYVFLDSYAGFGAAWAAAASGRIAQARAEAQEAAERARRNGQPAWEVRCRQAALQFGATGQAVRLAELADQVRGPRAKLAARWASALERHAPDELARVSVEFEEIGDRIAAADAAAHAAVAYRARQQRGPALTAEARAARLITACGASTPATRLAARPLPLTNREREIAELVSRGLSNKQIANELTLSVRTVEGNIYRCCTKLGLSDRLELAHLMSESGATA